MVGHTRLGDDLRRPRRRRAFDASTVATTNGANTSFNYPVSTPVNVGEVALPSGYTATIGCGQDAQQPYNGGPFPVTSPATGGATITCTITNTQQFSTVQVVKQWSGTPSSATIFVDQTASRRSTPRRSPPPTATTRPSTTRSRRRSPWARSRCPPATRRRSTAARLLPAVHGRSVPGHVPGDRRRDHHLHDHEHHRPSAPGLDRSRREAVGRRGLLGDDLRRPGRRRALRRLDGRHRRRRQHVLRLRRLDAGHRRRGHGARRLLGDDRLRPRPAALRGRALPGHVSCNRRRGPHLHDHEHPAVRHRPRREGVGRRALLGDDLRRPRRRRALRRLDGRHRRRRHHFLRLPGLDAGERWRGHGARRLFGDDRLRPGYSAALQRRAVPGHLPGDRRRDASPARSRTPSCSRPSAW